MDDRQEQLTRLFKICDMIANEIGIAIKQEKMLYVKQLLKCKKDVTVLINWHVNQKWEE